MFFGRQLLKFKNQTGLKIHLGCGPRVIQGWVNIDQFPLKGAFYSDLKNPIKLDSHSACFIHCEHVLEHIPREYVSSFFKECHRILAKNGCLRVVVPDSEKYMLAYSKMDEAFFEKLRNLGNAQSPVLFYNQIVNQMFRMGGDHLYAWDFEELVFELNNACLSKIVKSNWYHNDPDNIDGQEDWRKHESLYLNAYKE